MLVLVGLYPWAFVCLELFGECVFAFAFVFVMLVFEFIGFNNAVDLYICGFAELNVSRCVGVCVCVCVCFVLVCECRFV